MLQEPMIEAVGLEKRFGDTHALQGLGLAVAPGSILGVLGPNGAGKTTLVRILSTLALPDGGRARVAGYDVVSQAPAVRRHIGVTAQDATLDPTVTGRQNLVMIAELSGLRRAQARVRAAELLDEFGLTEAAERSTSGYSGGMRRRLDLAASMVARPPVLFLDEPTTGLDPASRLRVWQVIRGLADDGVTLLLTTQYLEEADSLADRIVVVDHGVVVAEGTSGELKTATGGACLVATLSDPSSGAVEALAPFVDGPVQVSGDGRCLRASIGSQPGITTAVVRALDRAGVAVDDIEVQHPSLDDAFLALTHQPTPASAPSKRAVATR